MKIRCFLMAFLLLFPLFSGCERTPNMMNLLAYEKETMQFSLHITDKTEFSADLMTSEETDTLTFTEGTIQGTHITFFKDGKVELSYEDYKTPLPSSSLLKALRWKELFHLSEKNLLWKIEKETLGGLAVYVCRADDVIVYIDSISYLPLQIQQGELVIDIIKSENLSEITPKA